MVTNPLWANILAVVIITTDKPQLIKLLISVNLKLKTIILSSYNITMVFFTYYINNRINVYFKQCYYFYILNRHLIRNYL